MAMSTQQRQCVSISNYFNWPEGMIICNLNNTVKVILPLIYFFTNYKELHEIVVSVKLRINLCIHIHITFVIQF